jgi:hypothetical protein
VVANIAKFGGDPKKITIAGSSAGAGSVRTLLGSPPAIPLFQGAHADSNLGGGEDLGLDGNYGTTYSQYLTINESYTLGGLPVTNATNCTAGDTAQQVACLRTANATVMVTGNDVARYVVQDGTIVNTPELVIVPRNGSAAPVPILFGVAANDGASFSNIATAPIANLSEGLQVGLGIDATNADSIIASGLFPLYDTGNLTLDAFNVTQRVATDNTFRCIDQATVFAASSPNSAFKAAYFYQFDRAWRGYNPNNLNDSLVQGPISPAYPNGNPSAANYFRLHGGTGPWIFGNPLTVDGLLRDDTDLYSLQLVSSYVGAFVRSGATELSLAELQLRGNAYARIAEAVAESGQWERVQGEMGPIRVLDWPSRTEEFVDVEQCAWLGYPLDFYL